MAQQNIVQQASKHWSLLIACVGFVASLWLAGVLNRKDLDQLAKETARIDARISSIEAARDADRREIAERLRSIDIQMTELVTVVREYQKRP